ncbi:TonB-dependent receptor [Leptolyngbya cf. ectocarpi LEGE 11479]|uniref:TonB-dependent receptor n=1 Tax=Leptolyngbya cf. ectocarpi LEGE 11479 TaxID=1828722 RepID=A0A928ZVE2_LEPEC|nr:TonB-dependent receptor [Leptolyngbya ectocarpi]MBE9068187.1 TonB-dependent receptor [Leptolyngbya cf. ectocarpi LEGE 11479]
MMKLSLGTYALGISGAIAIAIAQPAHAQTSIITAVQLTQTDTGLSLTLESAAEAPLQTFINRSGESTIVVDIADAQLQTGDTFQQDNPVDGIASITVKSLATNRIQVTIVGQDAAPEIAIDQQPGSLIFAVSPVGSDSEDPASDPLASEPTDEAPLRLVVTATRTEESVDDIGRSITVIDREQIEQQSIISSDLADILGNLVPGFGPPNQLRTTRGQTLRGREAAILIDGVPLSTNFRVNRQELRSIDPSAIERVEVIRGPSAIFGGQSTGGVINIITRRPVDGESSVEIQAGVSASLGDLEDDGFGTNLALNASERSDRADIRVSLSREETGSFFDADGNRNVSESSLSDTTSYNLLGKIGYDISEQQRLDLTLNYFNAQRETEFIASPATLLIPGRQTAQTLRIRGLDRDDNPEDISFLTNLSYSHADLLGSEVRGQLYYQDTTARGEFADGRLGIDFFPFLFQSRLEAERWGGRLQVETPLNGDETLNLLWGADYESQKNRQITAQFDADTFDNEQQLTTLQEFDFTPPYRVNSLGLFTQIDWEASESWLLRGGLRYENINLDVDDYFSVTRRRNIEGGNRSFDDVVFNASTVYQPADEISLFASFAQSFSVPEFSRILRLPPAGFVSVEDDFDITQPIKVTEYELGVRGNWPEFQTSLSGFYNTSDFGSSLVPNENGLLGIQRAPQRIYGVEATVDWQPADTWGLGGTVGWSEGENDVDRDGDYLPLNSGEIAPIKFTAYVENETLPGWNNRLQALIVGGRSRAADEGVEPLEIESYATLDFISSVDVGPGTLQVGVENIFDTQYFPAVAQFLSGFDDRNYVGGRGRTLRLMYSVEW